MSNCSGYTQLGSYKGANDTAPAGPKVIVVPNWSTNGYDSLTHGGVGGCHKYFSIKNAYGPNASTCLNYPSTMNRLCNPHPTGGFKGGCNETGCKIGTMCHKQTGKCVPI